MNIFMNINIATCITGFLIIIGGCMLMSIGFGKGNFERGKVGTFLYGCMLFVIGTGLLIYELTDFL